MSILDSDLRTLSREAAVDFFSLAADQLEVNPPHPTDFDQVARLSLLGIVPGRPFDGASLEADQVAELEADAVMAREVMQASIAALGRPVDGWVSYTDTMGVYGNYYLKRAMVTLVGLGANPADDAIYPVLVADSEGRQVDGDHDYVVHFDADALPPVAAFWSITMYDAEGFQAANELDRFAIGDRDALTYNDDGSLDIHIQHDNPGPDKVANWLPAPRGALGITMRLYAPSREVLSGAWTPPPVGRLG